MKLQKSIRTLIIFLIIYILFIQNAFAADFLFPSLNIGIQKGSDPGDISVILQIVFLLTVLTLAPAILILMTCFTRLVVVFSFLRHALGTQQTPSNQIIAGLALFLTFFIMMPVWQKINDNALQPYLNEEIQAVYVQADTGKRPGPICKHGKGRKTKKPRGGPYVSSHPCLCNK